MDSNYEIEQLRIKKKKYSKKGQSVPSDSLGFRAKFHADIIDPRNIKRSQIRSRKKYIAKASKHNFMARLRMIVDPIDLPHQIQNHLFTVTKKSQWVYVKKVLYRSRQLVHCSICLQQEIIAPQITFCGHIYCFHCILMHFTKSSNCFSCPVCKELTDKTELKTCETKYEKQLEPKDQITLNLKYRQGQYIYDADSLHQDLNSTHVIRMRTKGIIPIFVKQIQQIKNQLLKTNPSDRNHHYLNEALLLSTQKLNKIIQNSNKNHHHINLRENQLIKDNIVYRFIINQQAKKLHSFYQQKTGSLIFLHKLCKKYIDFPKQKPLLSIKSTILQRLQLDYSAEQAQYKQLSLFNLGSEVDVVIVGIENYSTPQNNIKFISQYENFIKQKEKYEKLQEVEMERLSKQFQEQQAYLRQLKQQQLSQFYFDVKLPPTLGPNDFNENSFPSLMGSNSQKQKNSYSQKENDKQTQSMQLKISNSKTEVNQSKQKIFNITKQVQSFPNLSQVKPIKPEQLKPGKGGRKKKKKQKFIDVTHQFMFNRQQEDND